MFQTVVCNNFFNHTYVYNFKGKAPYTNYSVVFIRVHVHDVICVSNLYQILKSDFKNY